MSRKSWRRSYPHIQFYLVSGNEDLIYDSLQKGLLDFGLVFHPLDPVIYSANYVVWRRDQVFSRAGRLVVAALDEAFSNHA